jgi:hypothetical protein
VPACACGLRSEHAPCTRAVLFRYRRFGHDVRLRSELRLKVRVPECLGAARIARGPEAACAFAEREKLCVCADGLGGVEPYIAGALSGCGLKVDVGVCGFVHGE